MIKTTTILKSGSTERTSVFESSSTCTSLGMRSRKKLDIRFGLKGVDGYATHLNENLDNHEWFFASDDDIKGYRIKHTRKELEANGFGWVFDCKGVEVKEVE